MSTFNKELLEIKIIINEALSRILSLKTERTYQQEVEFISETIQEYINITYVTKVNHEKELLKQIFNSINNFEKIQRNISKKHQVNDAHKVFGLQLAINELKTTLGEDKNE